MDETSPGLIGVEVRIALGCGDVIDRDLPGRAQLCILCEDVVFPLPDAGDRVVLSSPPARPKFAASPGRRPRPAGDRCWSAKGCEACG